MEKKADPAIERFLLHTMTPEEQQNFQKRLDSEPGLAAELAFYQALWIHRDQQAKARWAAKGKTLFQQTSQPQATPKTPPPVLTASRPNFHLRAIAAGLAFLLVATGVWYIVIRQNPYQQAYQAHYERLNSSSLLSTATGTPEQQSWQQAFDLYERKEYDAALNQASQLTSSPAYHNQAYLLTGACHLEQNRPEEAIRAFEQVEPSALSLYNKAQFNIALAYIRGRDVDKARVQLKKVAADPESPYRKVAGEILERLP